MRWCFLLLVLVCTTHLCDARADGPVGCWPFDESADGGTTISNTGSGGTALAGKLIGNAHLQRDVGDGTMSRRSVLALDGDGDWMRIDHGITSFGAGNSFTIGVWLKTEASKLVVLGKDDADGQFEGNEKIFFVKEGHGGREVGFVANGQNWISSTTRVNDGRWHHVAVVYDALLGTKRIFVDGCHVTTEANWTAGPDFGNVVRVGMSDWAGDVSRPRDVGPFRGYLDELVVYEQALTPAQIRVLIDGGPRPFDSFPELTEKLRALGGDPWCRLMRAQSLVRAHRGDTAVSPIDADDVRLGSWHCVGPFREAAFGNIRRAFAHLFEPERDILGVGEGPVDLTNVYEATRFPGMLDTARPWTEHPEWIDGYRHLLPRGPAPARNETVYLYRVIDARRPTTVEMNLYAEDSIGGWLNGQSLGQVHRAASQPSRFPSALCVPMRLAEGENRLLLKLTSLHAAHGFAFAVPGLTPSHRLRPGQWAEFLRSPETNFDAANRPYASSAASSNERPDREACVAAIARDLALPNSLVRDLLPAEKEADSLEMVRTLADRVARFSASLRLLGQFNFDVTMTPMFDPPDSRMDRHLHADLPPSPAAKAYVDRLAVLEGRAVEVLATAEESPDAVIDAAGAIESLWNDQIRAAGPIAFIRCPHFGVDARAPYSSAGAEPASICVFDPARPEEPVRVVFHEPGTRIFDMNVSFDGRTIFFSARRTGVPGGWQIFEIGVDGSNLKQITHDQSDNISPCLLPSGRIIFVSTRRGHWVICAPRRAGLLYVCERDGSNVRRVSVNIDSDHTPQVTNDGRVMFTRWDYGVEKNVFARHALWTMNPDGTGFRLFFGNTIEDPAGFWQARPIPGRPEVVCTFGPHHTYQAGMIGVLWDRFGTEAPRGEGFRFITDDIPSYCDTTFGHGYQDPFPIHERMFLASFGGDGGHKNRLYLIDDRGNRKCVYEAEGNLGCWSPMLLRPRPTPPVIPEQTDNPEFVYVEPVEGNRGPETGRTGTLLVQDVYRGISSHVERGRARFIQVMEQLPKTQMHKLDAWGTSPLVSRGTVHVRRLVGTVPIEEDGSAHFTVPALRNISLNVLDAEGKLLMRMGSDMHVMSGERQACIGCHENRQTHVAPMPAIKTTLAARREPSVPKRPDWGTRGLIDYVKVVQPVWDKHCVECHAGPTPEGGVDLSGDKTRFFNMSFDNLVERGLVDYHNVFALDHDETTPASLGSLVSEICRYIDTPEHSKHEIPLADRQRVYTWIDANVPYYATYVYSRGETVGSRDAWGIEGNMKGAQWPRDILDTFNRRCMDCHRREVYNPALYGGGATVSSKLWTDRGITAHGFPWRYRLSALIGPELRINLTHPGHSLLLSAPLAEDAGGLGLCRDADGRPFIFADKSDPDYRAVLTAIEKGRQALYARPRVDMADNP